MGSQMIPLNRPDSTKGELGSMLKRSKDSISRIEGEFGGYIGSNSIFTSSCRSALYLSYKLLNLKGEVIVSPLTCSLAVTPIICNGLKPCFADVDIDTYNIDPEKVNESITKNTCAIQVIHLGGNPCDMKPIEELASDHGLLLIEDCAQSLGALYRGEKVGGFGDVGCFSFMKNLFTIGGGILSTTNKEIVSNIREAQDNLHDPPSILGCYRFLRNISGELRGNVIGDFFYDFFMGLKNKELPDKGGECAFLEGSMYKPTHLEASVCILQFKKLNDFLRKRIDNAILLTNLLRGIPKVKVQKTTPSSRNVFTRYLLDTPHSSKIIIKKLQERGIEAKHLESKYGSFYQERFDRDSFFSRFESIKQCTNYLDLHDRIISLPISSNMNTKEINYIYAQMGELLESTSL